MPCYDPRGDEERHETARAACEMAGLIRKLTVELESGAVVPMFEALSPATQEWIRNHEEFDRKRG